MIFRYFFTVLLIIQLVLDEVFPSNSLLLFLITFNLFLCLVYSPKIKIDYRLLFTFLFLIVYFSLIEFAHLSTIESYLLKKSEYNIYTKNLFFSLGSLIFIPTLYNNEKRIFNKSIDLALGFLVTIFFLQLLLYQLNGVYFDPLSYLRGEESRYQAYSSILIFLKAIGVDYIRPTSLFNEPGTYCCYSTILFLLSSLNHKKFNLIHKLFISSLFLSLSAFGIAIGILILLFYYKKLAPKKSEVKFKLMTRSLFISLISIVILFAYSYVKVRFFSGLTSSTGSLDIRENSINILFNNLPNFLFFGFSPATTLLSDFEIQDTSLVFSIFMYYGLQGIIILGLIFFLVRKRFYSIGALIIILITKVSFESFGFWFLVVMLYQQNRYPRFFLNHE